MLIPFTVRQQKLPKEGEKTRDLLKTNNRSPEFTTGEVSFTKTKSVMQDFLPS